jgi:hypothetical protein
MREAEFRTALRAALGRVPLVTRRGWNGNDLFGWWMQTSNERPDLVLDGYQGDLWQRVHGMCMNMYMVGEQAVM